ncbi:MAG: hypothetical protein AABX23_00740 [Nanoarchaeota archaeon]
MSQLLKNLMVFMPALALTCCQQSGPNGSSSCDLEYERLYTRENPSFAGFELGMGDSHSLVNNCGFRYWGNRQGGYGNTLEIIGGPGDSMYFVWLGDTLSRISLRNGWNGETENGLKIGDDFSKFNSLHPSAMRTRVAHYYPHQQNNIWDIGHFRANFNDVGKISLMEIRLNYYDYGTTNYIDNPIGPWSGSFEQLWR